MDFRGYENNYRELCSECAYCLLPKKFNNCAKDIVGTCREDSTRCYAFKKK